MKGRHIVAITIGNLNGTRRIYIHIAAEPISKDVYFNSRDAWNEMVRRNMRKDVSWVSSADKYLKLYDELMQ